MTAAPKTVLEFIQHGMTLCEEADIYLGHGTDSLWDEVLVLVLHVLQIPLDADPAILDDLVPEDKKAPILALIQERIEVRKPVAYMLNEGFFAGLSFYVDERVIIPRSPMAECIEQGFAPWVQPEKVTRILDMCTGSGCIAIACAKAFPDVPVDAVDLSPDALAVATKNVAMHDVGDQLTLIQSDLFSAVPKQQYDVIISNPPYVSDAEMAELPKEYLHEPDMSLRADDEGLALAFSIMQSACDYLTDDGILIIEVGNSQEALMRRHPDWPLVWLEFARGGEGVFLISKRDLMLLSL